MYSIFLLKSSFQTNVGFCMLLFYLKIHNGGGGGVEFKTFNNCKRMGLSVIYKGIKMLSKVCYFLPLLRYLTFIILGLVVFGNVYPLGHFYDTILMI